MEIIPILFIFIPVVHNLLCYIWKSVNSEFGLIEYLLLALASFFMFIILITIISSFIRGFDFGSIELTMRLLGDLIVRPLLAYEVLCVIVYFSFLNDN